MSRRSLLVSIVAGIVALVALRHCVAGQDPPAPGIAATRVAVPDDVLRAPSTVATVTRVIDGDSLEVRLRSGIIEVRLSGVDAPEHGQPGADAARDALRRRLGPRASVVLAPVTIDDYGRLVANASHDGLELEPWLLREGHAWAYRRYTSDARYCQWEHEARNSRRGLWAAPAEGWIAPWAWRRHMRATPDAPILPARVGLEECLAALRNGSHAPVNPTGLQPGLPAAPDAQCTIKGNINSRGERIYHLPGAPGYEATRIEPARGERWFCNEQEARDAGWRPPR